MASLLGNSCGCPGLPKRKKELDKRGCWGNELFPGRHSPNETVERGEKVAEKSLNATASYWSHACGNQSLPSAALCYFSPRPAFSTMSASCIRAAGSLNTNVLVKNSSKEHSALAESEMSPWLNCQLQQSPLDREPGAAQERTVLRLKRAPPPLTVQNRD